MRGGDHQRERRAVARTVVGRVCWRCGEPIKRADRWDLDHVDEPWCDGGRGRRLPAHALCNRRAGGKLGAARRRQRQQQRRKENDMQWTAIGVEVAADRRQTWVALAGVRPTGHVVVKLLDPADGTAVVPLLERLWSKLDVEAVGLDPQSPSATLVEPLQAEGLPLKLADARAVAVAHGRFADLLTAGRLKVRGNRALDQAARQAATRRLAGGQAVERYGTADLAPLVAAQLAAWALGDPDHQDGLGPDDITVAAI